MEFPLNQVIFWLILTTRWAYFGSTCSPNGLIGITNKAEFFGYKSERSHENVVKASNDTNALGKEQLLVEGKKGSDLLWRQFDEASEKICIPKEILKEEGTVLDEALMRGVVGIRNDEDITLFCYPSRQVFEEITQGRE